MWQIAASGCKTVRRDFQRQQERHIQEVTQTFSKEHRRRNSKATGYIMHIKASAHTIGPNTPAPGSAGEVLHKGLTLKTQDDRPIVGVRPSDADRTVRQTVPIIRKPALQPTKRLFQYNSSAARRYGGVYPSRSGSIQQGGIDPLWIWCLRHSRSRSAQSEHTFCGTP